MKARGNRDKVLVFTKVGSDMGQGHRDLSAKWIEEEVEASLKRLQTDYIDLYQSHWPDPNTPQEETLRAHSTGWSRRARCASSAPRTRTRRC